jgi:DNA invertase Pin-like site-specific DNA recombinase
VEQNDERQLDGLKLDRIFTDKASGKDTNRPQLLAALAHAREGDIFTVHSMDRLARNVEDILRLVRELNGRGVSLEFVKENMTFTAGTADPRNTLMFTMLSAFSEFERALIRERQREGIEIAKSKGIYKGRKPTLNPENLDRLRERAKKKGTNKAKLAREYGISRATLYQYLRSDQCTKSASTESTPRQYGIELSSGH